MQKGGSTGKGISKLEGWKKQLDKGGGGESSRKIQIEKKNNHEELYRLRALATKSERRTVVELKQRSVGGRPLPGAEFKSEVFPEKKFGTETKGPRRVLITLHYFVIYPC